MVEQGRNPIRDGIEPPRTLLDLTAALRVEGVDVAADDVTVLLGALAELAAPAPLSARDLYLAARATLVHRAEDLATFHRCFLRVLVGEGAVGPASAARADALAVAVDAGEGEGGGSVTHLRWSRTERLRHADVATCDPEELEAIWKLIASWRPPDRRRRHRRQGSGAREVDLRRSVRASMRHGGEVVLEHRRRPGPRPRKVVLLVDVSGSMAPYVGTWLRFAGALARHDREVEVFVAATRLTRVTPALRGSDPEVAVRTVASAAPDLAGGTRLGDALEGLRRWSSPAPLVRGADLVVLSDGWDQGDPELVSRAMAALGRATHRLIWANPWKASEGFEPIARGMAAANEHVDALVEGHSMAALQSLVGELSWTGSSGGVRRAGRASVELG